MLPYYRLDELRKTRPLIHCIANLVSANDCANVLLAAGASPMMAQAPEEMEEIAAISSATILNIGTPDGQLFTACRLSGGFAAKNQPVVLDPVGVGATAWRLKETEKLLESFAPAIIRLNLGEAQALLHRAGEEQGVDSTAIASAKVRMDCARALARRSGAAVLLSGPEDVITDGRRGCRIFGGSAWMARVTGTGCMLSVLCGAFAAVEPDMFLAASLASAFWKVCAAKAESALVPGQGAGAFRSALMDAASALETGEFARLARAETL
ncbi:hydroxyethylthiazole kinase [Oscillibacter valericigenes Sjm18-20]|nr:hydroxyethylthiazole kinase [Oscillibacter valericigenes Sjm18-20]